MREILVVEDEAAIRDLISINLSRVGYKVFEAENGKQAIEVFHKHANEIDIALLDIMMPVLDGIELCKILRHEKPSMGIIFLTAKTQEQDKVNGLYSGADDYVTKPFSTNELLARIEAVYRRVLFNKELLNKLSDEIISGDFLLSTKKRAVFFKDKKIELSQIEYEILECLFANQGKTISREQILNQVWGDSYYGDDKVVDVNIRRLRIKIEKDPSCPKHLTTVWGKGYKWE